MLCWVDQQQQQVTNSGGLHYHYWHWCARDKESKKVKVRGENWRKVWCDAAGGQACTLPLTIKCEGQGQGTAEEPV